MKLDKTIRHKRSVERLVQSETQANSAIMQVKAIYEKSLDNIRREINDVYSKYSDKTGLSIEELNQILSGSEKKDFLIKIQQKMKALGFDVEDVYDRNYINQITRLKAIRQQVYWEVMQIQPKELETTAQVYERIIATSYIKTGKDILESIPDANVAFSIYDKSIIQAIIKRPLAGATFNDTIFRNIKVLSKTVETTIGGALAMGQSYQKTTKQVEELLGIGKRQAMRVVRTQSNYYNNQAELQVYEDLGVKKYQYSAFLDMRTSSICKRLHNKIFEVKDAKVGENYPPMHPNCRSTTNEVLSKADERHIAKLIRPQTLIELENKWGVNTNMRTDTGATKLGYGSIVTKLNQGYNKQLNAEAEYISQVYSKLKPKRKYEAYERIKEIKDLSKDTAQIELVLKYLEKPKLDRRIKKD